MPGWFIHMDAARKALDALPNNASASAVFQQDTGPSATDLRDVAKANPAYVALGAIGPDIFFLYPDFKPNFVGKTLWTAADTIDAIYTWWDTNFLTAYEKELSPFSDYTSDMVAAATGDLSKAISDITSRAFSFLMDTALTLIVRSYDVFSFLGSGVPGGSDEATFFWSDMLHYRKTFEFARYLWQHAETALDENGNAPDDTRKARRKAFALGWMTHLATDVAGHCFVNEKCGGPYRLHWQRHHLIENHMDGAVYDSEHGTDAIYNMLSNAALHLWVTFQNDGSSLYSFFDSQPAPNYPPGDKTPDILGRHKIWDRDSDLSDDLAAYIANALKAVYPSRTPQQRTATGQAADHPMIVNLFGQNTDVQSWARIFSSADDTAKAQEDDTNYTALGYAGPGRIQETYKWLQRYLKFTTTDYYKIRKPPPPLVIDPAPFPSPPGSGVQDPSPGAGMDNTWASALDILLAILAWLLYLAEVAVWPVQELVSLITTAGTYPLRELLYDNVELPLYNAWEAMHWYLAMSGFTYPSQQEINPALNTLGIGVDGVWDAVLAALADPAGGLLGKTPVPATEPSGKEGTRPIDVVLDPPDAIQHAVDGWRGVECHAGEERPSEFKRPWLWPAKDNAGDAIQLETPITLLSPYKAPTNATALMGKSPGDNGARRAFEQATSEAGTIVTQGQYLPQGLHLGDPVDYSSYVLAWLTRDNLAVSNFNLDADRGYGYLCWDWVRSATYTAEPNLSGADPNQMNAYHAPLRPGYGWCDGEIDARNAWLKAHGQAAQPPITPVDKTKPEMQMEPQGGHDVRIRYIDREKMYDA